MDDPASEHDVVRLVALQRAEQPESIAVKHCGADDRLQDVVAQRHLPDRCQARGRGGEHAGLDDHHHDGDVAETDEDACGLVDDVVEPHGDVVEVDGDITPHVPDAQRQSDAVPDDGHLRVEAKRAFRRQRPGLHHSHAEQHHGQHVPQDGEVHRREMKHGNQTRAFFQGGEERSSKRGVHALQLSGIRLRPLDAVAPLVLGVVLLVGQLFPALDGGGSGRGVVAHRQAVIPLSRHRERHQDREDRAHDRQPARRQSPHRVEQQSKHRVRIKDFSKPQQVGVGDAKQHQPDHAPVVNVGGISARAPLDSA